MYAYIEEVFVLETFTFIRMISFVELTKQVHLINDLILSDMICGMLTFVTSVTAVNNSLYPPSRDSK